MPRHRLRPMGGKGRPTANWPLATLASHVRPALGRMLVGLTTGSHSVAVWRAGGHQKAPTHLCHTRVWCFGGACSLQGCQTPPWLRPGATPVPTDAAPASGATATRQCRRPPFLLWKRNYFSFVCILFSQKQIIVNKKLVIHNWSNQKRLKNLQAYHICIKQIWSIFVRSNFFQRFGKKKKKILRMISKNHEE